MRWQLGRYAWKVLERVILTMGGVGGRCKKGLPAQVGSQGKHRNTQVSAVVGGGSGGQTPGYRERGWGYGYCCHLRDRSGTAGGIRTEPGGTL